MAGHPVSPHGSRGPRARRAVPVAGWRPALRGVLLACVLALLAAAPLPARAGGERGAPGHRSTPGNRSALGDRGTAGERRQPDKSQAALLRQLKEGTVPQRRAALRALADHGEPSAVPGVAAALHDDDTEVRELAGEALWAIWSRSGDPEVDEMLRVGTDLLERGLNAQAVVVFTRIIHRAPDFAEGYNKRATAYYQMGEYERSLDDIAQVLKRNPYHFGALSGAGLCMVELGRLPAAVAYFNRALKINPNLDGIRQLKQAIEKHLHQPLI